MNISFWIFNIYISNGEYRGLRFGFRHKCGCYIYDMREWESHSCNYKPATIKYAAIRLSDGVSFFGRRHNDCIYSAILDNRPPPITGEQGFLTNSFQFVSREEAAEIAFKAGQIKELKKELYSEDIY